MPTCRWRSAGGAQPAQFPAPHGPVAAFTVDPPVFAPGEKVTFTAQPSPGARYTWLFGDGTQATGRRVRHRFPDAEGTELDGAANGAGRFRVLLHVEDASDRRRSGLGRAGSGGRGPMARRRKHRRRHAARPRLADLSRRVDRAAESRRRARGLHRRSRPTCTRMRRALRVTPPRGTASSTFPPTAAIPFICWTATARGW